MKLLNVQVRLLFCVRTVNNNIQLVQVGILMIILSLKVKETRLEKYISVRRYVIQGENRVNRKRGALGTFSLILVAVLLGTITAGVCEGGYAHG